MIFSELGLAPDVLKALDDEGYQSPTPIQSQAIPAVLAGSDILGIAQTGTGKTAAFALPLLTRIATDRRPAPRRGARILVLSPTRELAAQIGESFRTYGRHLGVSVAVVFGGVAHKPQIDALARGVDVLVATPGRLIDHIETRVVTLEAVEALVLDEADQMLDLGFVRPIRRIVSKLRARRQNLFFSATMPHEIAALAAELLNEPVKVQVTPVATTAERVRQRVIHIEAAKKRSLLVELLGDASMQRTLVFTRTKRGADRVARHLEEAGIAAAAIHGNKSQRQREIALEAFRNGKTGVLVATDIAARGIDIDAVSHVVNYELPEVPEAYVHRIGRTARAGAEGDAISLCGAEERDLLRAIERLTRQSIPAEDRRNDASIAADAPSRGLSGGRGARNHRGASSSDRSDRGAHRGERNERSNGERSRHPGPHAGAPQERSRDGARSHAGEGQDRFERGAQGGVRNERSNGERSRHPRPHAGAPQERSRDGARTHAGEGRDRFGRGAQGGERNERSNGERSRHSRPHAGAPKERSRDGARTHAGEGRDRFDRGAQGGGRNERSAHGGERSRHGDADQRRGRNERNGNGQRSGRADGEAVAHVFNGGKRWSERDGRDTQNRRQDGGGRPQQGRGDHRASSKPSHGGGAGKQRRDGGGKPHRGAHGSSGQRRVDA